MNNNKVILNIGSNRHSVSRWTSYFKDWKEIKADVAEVDPDIVTDITTLSGIENNSIDAIWASHVIEHCHWHEQPMIFHSMLRVLKDDGFAIIKVPDLGSIANFIEKDLLTPILALENNEFITVLDMLYGYRKSLDPNNEEYNPAMAHKTGFNTKLVADILSDLKLNGTYVSVNHEITMIFWKSKESPPDLELIKQCKI